MADLYYIEQGYYDVGYFAYVADAESTENTAFALTADSSISYSASSTLDSAVTLTVEGRVLKEASIFVDSWASVTADIEVIRNASSSLTSNIVLDSTGTLIKYGDSELSSAVSIAVDSTLIKETGSDLSSAVSVIADGTLIKYGDSAVASNFELSSSSTVIQQISSDLSSAISVIVDGTLIKYGDSSLATNFTVTSTAGIIFVADSTLSTETSVTAQARLIKEASIFVDAWANVTADARNIYDPVLNLSATISTAIDGTLIKESPSSLESNFVIASTDTVIKESPASLDFSSTISASGAIDFVATENFVATTNLSITGRLIKEASIFVDAWASVTADSEIIKNALASLTSNVTFTSSGSYEYNVTAAITSTSTLSATGTTAYELFAVNSYLNSADTEQGGTPFLTDSARNFYVVFPGEENGSRILIAKYNSTGVLQWITRPYDFSGSAARYWLRSVTFGTLAFDTDGYLYAVGAGNGGINNDLGNGGGILKLNASTGAIIWGRRFGHSSSGSFGPAAAHTVDIGSSNQVYVSGSGLYGYDPNLGGSGTSNNQVFWLTRYDTSGNLVWARHFYNVVSGYPQSLESVNGRVSTKDDYSSVSFDSYWTFSSGWIYNTFVHHLNNSTRQWRKRLGSRANSHTIQVDSNYNTIFSRSNSNLIVSSISTSGTIQWTKGLSSLPTPELDYYLIDSTIDENNNVYLLIDGSETTTNYRLANILKIDSSGNLVWARRIKRNTSGTTTDLRFRSIEYQNGAIQLAGRGYINGVNNSFVLRLDTLGIRLGNIGPNGSITISSLSLSWATQTETLVADTTSSTATHTLYISQTYPEMRRDTVTVGNYTVTELRDPMTFSESLNLSSNFVQTTNARITIQGTASLITAATLSATAITPSLGQASLDSNFIQTAVAGYKISAASVLASNSTLAAQVDVTRDASAAVTANFVQTVDANITRDASAGLIAIASQSATAESIPAVFANAQLNSNFIQDVSIINVRTADSALTTQFTSSVSADVEHNASLAIDTAFSQESTARILKEISLFADGFATLTVSADVEKNANANLTSQFIVESSAISNPAIQGTAFLNAYATVTAIGDKSSETGASLFSNIDLVCSGNSIPAVQANANLNSQFTVSSSATSTTALQASANLVDTFTSVAVGKYTANAESSTFMYFTSGITGRISNVRAQSTLNVISILNGVLVSTPRQDLNLTVYVGEEERGYLVLPETRSFIVDYEDRIGNVLPESRLSTVESETRINILL